MPPTHPTRSMDAIRQLFEDQQEQINDLTGIIKLNFEKIKRLEDEKKETLRKAKSSTSCF